MRASLLALLGISLTISACTNTQTNNSKENRSVPVSKVINELKKELDLFSKTSPSDAVTAYNACSDTGNTQVGIIPVNASIQLKVITSDSYNGSADAKIPIAATGTTLDPGISGGVTRLNTQQFTIDLEIYHYKTKAELREDIERLQKEISVDEKYASAHTDYKSHIDSINETKKKMIDKEYYDLIGGELGVPSVGYGGDKYNEYNPDAFKNHPLADALYKIREGLLHVDHAQKPCLKPNQIKAEIAFQVTEQEGTKLGFSFFIVSIGGELSHSDDRTQLMTVTFDLADTSSFLSM